MGPRANSQKNLKTPEQINRMKEGGHILATILKELETMITPGLEVWALEEHFLKRCKDFGVIPTCKGYDPYELYPFPTGLCVSINSQCVHGIPKKGRFLKENDVITVDTVITHKGLNVDSSFAKVLGTQNQLKTKLVATSRLCLEEAIKVVREGITTGAIGNVIEKTAKAAGLNVLEDYAGHGIGTEMHEEPEVPCTGKPGQGTRLVSGMTICIESLVCTGKNRVRNTNIWETEMADKGFFAQFEHTVLVLPQKCEIITQ